MGTGIEQIRGDWYFSSLQLPVETLTVWDSREIPSTNLDVAVSCLASSERDIIMPDLTQQRIPKPVAHELSPEKGAGDSGIRAEGLAGLRGFDHLEMNPVESGSPSREENAKRLASAAIVGTCRGEKIIDRGPFHIAFAIQRYFEFGGLQRSMLRVAKACAARGHRITVLTNEWKGSVPDGIEVRLLGTRALTNHGAAKRFSQAVRRCIRSEFFDCVVGYSRMQRLDVYWCGDPCLDDAMDHKWPGFLRWLPRYYTYLKLERAVMRCGGTTELLVLCPQERDRLARRYRTEPSRMHLLPPGIDPRRLAVESSDSEIRAEVRSELGITADSFVALTVGSSFRTKGVDRSIRALAQLPADLRRKSALVVVGMGEPASFQKLARKLGIADRIYFAGGRHDVAKFYHAADLLLHPARTETAGHAILEAMMCGTPVIVTANCGYAFHVESSQAGLVCPMPFSQQVLSQLVETATSPDLRRLWKERAQQYCATTNMVGMIDHAVETILARAAKNKRDRSAGTTG